MNFKIDENLPVEIAETLRRHGHDALTVSDQRLSGRPDAVLASACQADERAMVTLDLDFSDIRQYPPLDHHGILVLRPAVQNITSLVRIIERIVPLLDQEPLVGSLWVVDDHQVRIRGAGEPGRP